jgi:hypothetical protein
MDNLARKNESRIVKYIDLNKERPGNWQYVDLDKFERDIREDETRKWVELRRRERARQKLRKEAFWSVVLATLAVRLIGLGMVLGSIAASLYFHDGSAALVGIPFGALFMICPGHNSISDEMDNYIS